MCVSKQLNILGTELCTLSGHIVIVFIGYMHRYWQAQLIVFCWFARAAYISFNFSVIILLTLHQSEAYWLLAWNILSMHASNHRLLPLVFLVFPE